MESIAGDNLNNAIDKSCMVLIVTTHGRVIRANNNLLKRLGRSHQNIRGLNISDLFCGKNMDFEIIIESLQSTLSEKVLEGQLLSFAGKGDVTVHISAGISIDQSSEDGVVTIIGNEVDPNWLGALETTVRAEHAVHDRIIKIQYDLDGRITSINDTAATLLGYSPAHLIGRAEEAILSSTANKQEESQKKWEQLRQGKSSIEHCLHLSSQNGEDIFIQAYYEPIYNNEEKLAHVLMIGFNISKLELQLQRSTKLIREKSKALKSTLHETREAYRTINELENMLEVVASPVTPIWDGVLLLPLIGIVNSKRIDDAMKTILQKISTYDSRIFILDISGVSTVDGEVANQLIRITKATIIMGCETIISGVSPLIAHTIADLGVEVGKVLTTASLRDALTVSLKRVTLINDYMAGKVIGSRSDPNTQRKNSVARHS